jgi:hypothetical protein
MECRESVKPYQGVARICVSSDLVVYLMREGRVNTTNGWEIQTFRMLVYGGDFKILLLM